MRSQSLKIAYNHKLIWTVHGLIDGIALYITHGAQHRLRPRVEAAQVALVKFQGGGFIVRMVEVSRCLVALQGLIDGRRQRSLQA